MNQFLFVHVNEWGDFETPDAIPISQGFILANLKKHGYSGTILGDYKNRPLVPAAFKSLFHKTRPTVLGFSVYEENINRIRCWARFAKSLNNNVPVVLGGPQTTFMPGEALQQMTETDILCRGDGETVMLDLANALAANRPLREVPGICCRDNGHIIETGPNPGPVDLDTLPFPVPQCDHRHLRQVAGDPALLPWLYVAMHLLLYHQGQRPHSPLPFHRQDR